MDRIHLSGASREDCMLMVVMSGVSPMPLFASVKSMVRLIAHLMKAHAESRVSSSSSVEYSETKLLARSARKVSMPCMRV